MSIEIEFNNPEFELRVSKDHFITTSYKNLRHRLSQQFGQFSPGSQGQLMPE